MSLNKSKLIQTKMTLAWIEMQCSIVLGRAKKMHQWEWPLLQTRSSAEGMHFVFHTLLVSWRQKTCFTPLWAHPAVHTGASIRRPTRCVSH